MKIFICVCGAPVHVQNNRCQHCGSGLGVPPDQLQTCAIDAVRNGLFHARSPAFAEGIEYCLCRNDDFEQGCNCLAAADEYSLCCRACRIGNAIPDLSADTKRVRHEGGLIAINLAEADDSQCDRIRQGVGGPIHDKPYFVHRVLG